MKWLIVFTTMLLLAGCNNVKQEENKQEASMRTFQKINPKEIGENVTKLIGDKWMLVTAGDSAKFNTMTANWGTMGYLWNKPVAVVFIRPQRYTFEFIENKDCFTLSFFKETNREALKICGSESGRDGNKVEKAGLTPRFLESGNVAFEEAELIVECKKVYADFLSEDAFIDKDIPGKWYPDKDYHKMYVAEIVNVWQKK